MNEKPTTQTQLSAGSQPRQLSLRRVRRMTKRYGLFAGLLGGYLLGTLKGFNDFIDQWGKIRQRVQNWFSDKAVIEVSLADPPNLANVEVAYILPSGTGQSLPVPARFSVDPGTSFKLIGRGPRVDDAILDPAFA